MKDENGCALSGAELMTVDCDFVRAMGIKDERWINGHIYYRKHAGYNYL